MSRSRRRTPIHGIASGSEKSDKRIWHKRLRAAEREAIHHDREVLPEERDVSNPYGMAKDGKVYAGWETEWGKELRRK